MTDPKIPADDPNYLAMRQLVLTGDCAGFIGAGLSIPPCPTWKESVKRLCEACGCPELPPEEASDGDTLMRKADECSRTNPVGYRKAIADIFSSRPTETRKGYNYLVRLPFQMLLTTNFDLSLRDAARREDYGNVYVYPHIPLRLSYNGRAIYYLHGCLGASPAGDSDEVVFGLQAFDRAYGDDSLLPGFLLQVLTYEDIVFLGCSLAEKRLCRTLVTSLHIGGRVESTPTRYALVPREEPRYGGVSEEKCRLIEANDDQRLLSLGIVAVRYERGGDDHRAIEMILEDWMREAGRDKAPPPIRLSHHVGEVPSD